MNVTNNMANSPYSASTDTSGYKKLPLQGKPLKVATQDVITISIQAPQQGATQPAGNTSQSPQKSSDILGAVVDLFKAIGKLISGNQEQKAPAQSQQSKASDTLQMIIDLLKSIMALLGMGEEKKEAKPAAPAPMPIASKPSQGGGETGVASSGAAGSAAPMKGDIGTFETDGNVGFTQKSLDQGIASAEGNIGKRNALLEGFDKYETKAFGDKADGVIGKKDLEAMAKDQSLDPSARQAAQELLNNPGGEFAKSMNIHSDGKMFEGKQDIGITRDSINNANVKDQKDVADMRTLKGGFDAAETKFSGGGEGDGHIGRRDLEKIATDSNNPLSSIAKKALEGDLGGANIHTNGMLDSKKAA